MGPRLRRTRYASGIMSETAIMIAIRDAVLTTRRALLWRNNVGRARMGAAWVQFGLGVGSADLIGVLKPSGRGFALEVKTATGRLSPEQIAWHRAWSEAGGFVACVRSVEEALRALEEACR